MENKKMDKKIIDESILNITRALGKVKNATDADTAKNGD
jgi:hypothetical protein